jgi:hypothetical protein
VLWLTSVLLKGQTLIQIAPTVRGIVNTSPLNPNINRKGFHTLSNSAMLSSSLPAPQDSKNKLAKAKVELANALKESQIPDKPSEEFRQVANGVFQSEGTLTARIKKGKAIGVFFISPVLALVQTYTPESLKFFVRLYNETGRVGSLSLVITLSGELQIRFVSES